MNSRVLLVASAFLAFLSFFPGSVSSAVVTLQSVEVYTTHKWIEKKHALYFKCSGESKTLLPGVKDAGVLYSFEGEESWQPLTELQTKRCKRCRVYEDLLVSDHVFDEWELCPSNFDPHLGSYTHFREKEINATFLCQECSSLTSGPRRSMKDSKSAAEKGTKSAAAKKSHVVPVVITIIVILLGIFASVTLYKWWQKRKRQREQARFMKLFDEDDEMDDELGLREM